MTRKKIQFLLLIWNDRIFVNGGDILTKRREFWTLICSKWTSFYLFFLFSQGKYEFFFLSIIVYYKLLEIISTTIETCKMMKFYFPKSNARGVEFRQNPNKFSILSQVVMCWQSFIFANVNFSSHGNSTFHNYNFLV